MADSDNSTTLPFVTRPRKRRMAVFNPTVLPKAAKPSIASNGPEPDQALMVAQLWRDAQANSLSLCRRQQRLETMLMRAVGSSLAAHACTNADATVDTDRAARWRQMDDELGYSRTKDAEEQAAEIAAQLLEKLACTPAQSVEGVIAKVDVIARDARTLEGTNDFPWPQLRSALTDLKEAERYSEAGIAAGHLELALPARRGCRRRRSPTPSDRNRSQRSVAPLFMRWLTSTAS